METTTNATAPSPEQPLQSSLSGGQGGDKNLSVQKVNKPTGSISTRPREKTKINTFDEMYRFWNFVRFFIIKSSNEANLTKLNMFKVDKAVTNHIGPFEKISEDINDKTWTIEVKKKNTRR